MTCITWRRWGNCSFLERHPHHREHASGKWWHLAKHACDVRCLGRWGIDADLITARLADESIVCSVPAPPVTTHWARDSRLLRQWGVGRQ